MAYSVYSFASQYTHGLVGIYVGTREENLGPCVEIASEQLLDIASGNVRPEEIARAKENLKGRIMLSMESTSNRMTRLGKSLITDTELLSFERIIAEIEAVEPDESPSSQSTCSHPRSFRSPASAQRASLSRRRAPNQSGRARPRGVKLTLNGRGGKVGRVLAPGLEAAGHELVGSKLRMR